MEIHRTKNIATRLYFPLVDAEGALVIGSGNPDSEFDTWNDGADPGGFVNCNQEATAVGATGWYELNLIQAEMNFDYIAVQIKSDDALTQCILINTKPLTALAAIQTATDNLPGDPASETNVNANETKIDTAITDIAAVKTETALIVGDTNEMQLKLPAGDLVDSSDVETVVTAYIQVVGDIVVDPPGATDTVFETTAGGAANDHYNGHLIVFTGGNLIKQGRYITDYVGADGTITVSPAFTEAPANGDSFLIYSMSRVPPVSGGGDWTANEKTEISAVLGITDTGTPDSTPGDGVLKEIQDNVDTNEGKIDALPAVGEYDVVIAALQTDLDNPNQYKATGFSTHAAADVWTAGSRALSTPADYKADVSGVATTAALNTHDGKLDGVITKTDNLPTNTDTELKEIKSLSKHNLAVEFDWDGSDDNNQTDFYGYDTAANATTNDHSTGKLVHIKGTTASFTDHKPATTIFIDADE